MQKVLPLDRYSYVVASHNKAFAVCKRLFDIVASAVLLVVFLPVSLVVALIAAVDTKGSPIFVQTRMGRGNRPFKMLKFRTMYVDTPADVPTYQLANAEACISRTGAILRKLSLDELPQLWNILKGDMSFVGPRPVVLTEKELLGRRSRNGAASVRPGLTGWAQVNGRDTVTIVEKARYDGYYANHMSLRLDIKVLLKTVGYVLHSRGVSEGENPAIAKVRNGEQSA